MTIFRLSLFLFSVACCVQPAHSEAIPGEYHGTLLKIRNGCNLDRKTMSANFELLATDLGFSAGDLILGGQYQFKDSGPLSKDLQIQLRSIKIWGASSEGYYNVIRIRNSGTNTFSIRLTRYIVDIRNLSVVRFPPKGACKDRYSGKLTLKQ